MVPVAERERYRLYAYRLLPVLFHQSGEETDHPLPELTAVPIPERFSCLGYDAVVRHVGTMHSGRQLKRRVPLLAVVMGRHG